MNFLKTLAAACFLLAAAVLAPSANAAPPTIVLAAAGSSAVFNALYDAAKSSGVCGNNLWSQHTGDYSQSSGGPTTGGLLHDARSSFSSFNHDDPGAIWVAFDGTAAANYTDTTTICFYIAADSAVGVRGFLAAPRNLLRLAASPGGTGENQVGLYGDNVLTLPQAIYNDIDEFGTACAGTTMTSCTTVTGVPMNAAFSDVRPEDAQFATFRALSERCGYVTGNPDPNNPNGTPCGRFLSSNLGYGNWHNPYDAGPAANLWGYAIPSSFTRGLSAAPTYFEQVPGIVDAASGQHTGQYAVYPVGALPLIVAVSNTDTTAQTGLGNGVPGNYLLKNADRFTLSYIFDGVLTRTRDLTGVAGAANVPLEEITFEPLSGTHTTFEFTVPRSHDVQASLEDDVFPMIDHVCACLPPTYPSSPNVGGRFRAIGTAQMVRAINGLQPAPNPRSGTTYPADANRIGYFLWGYGNIKPLAGSGCTSTVSGLPLGASVSCATNPSAHYLLVDGVDPLFNTPFDNPQGPLNPPTCTALPCPAIPFTHVNDGSYSAWTMVRMIVDPTVTTIPSSTGIGQIYATLESASFYTNFSDFDPVSNLTVFRVHKGAGWGAQGVPAAAFQAVNGNLCAPPYPPFSADFTGVDMGSDAGGAILSINGDLDFAFDSQGGITPSSAHCGQTGGSNLGLVGQAQ